MRIRILVLASMAAMSLAGAVWAQSARDTAGDYFVAAAMSTPHDSVLVAGESRGQAGHAFLLPNNGARLGVCGRLRGGVHRGAGRLARRRTRADLGVELIQQPPRGGSAHSVELRAHALEFGGADRT